MKMLAGARIILKITYIQKRPRAIACEVSIHENLILKKIRKVREEEETKFLKFLGKIFNDNFF